MILPDGNEVLPRLWIGTPATCDVARQEGLFCLCVLEESHNQPGCTHFPILKGPMQAPIDRVMLAGHYIDRFIDHGPGILVHCGGGAERSPLVVAVWMCKRFNMDLDEAYAWLKSRRQQVEDRRRWLVG